MKKSGKEVKEKEGAKQQHFTTTLERKKNHSKTHRWHFLIKLLDFYRGDCQTLSISIFFLKELFLTQYSCLLSSRYILTISSYIPSDCYAIFLNYYDDFVLYSLEQLPGYKKAFIFCYFIKHIVHSVSFHIIMGSILYLTCFIM